MIRVVHILQRIRNFNGPFSNLILFQALLFRLYLRKFANNLVVFTHKKIRFQNFKPIFPVTLLSFDLECHGENFLKVACVIFGVVFMKFRLLKSLHREN